MPRGECGRMYRARVFSDPSALSRTLTSEIESATAGVFIESAGWPMDPPTVSKPVTGAVALGVAALDPSGGLGNKGADTALLRPLLIAAPRVIIVACGAAVRPVTRTFLMATHETEAGRALAGHPRVEVWFDAEAWPLG